MSVIFITLIMVGCSKKDVPPSSGNEQQPPDPELPDKPTPKDENAIAFPGAEGGGKNATGGRGGKVIKVTNLNNSGSGSLRAAIEASGPRIVVFEVSGNIELQSRIQIKNGDLTIAGQTAPGDGITIQNYEVNVAADNVIIRFVRFRMGDLTQNENDALWGRYQKNIIIDHCSMSWSIDETSSFYANENFTMQWCFLTESLNKSFHEKDDHGYGGIWGGVNASFHHNLLAHHNSRMPRFDGGSRSGTGKSPFGPDEVDFRNNVIYNWGNNSAYGGENGAYNMIANYYKPGPGTSSSKRSRIIEVYKEADPSHGIGYGRFFIDQNYIFGNEAVSADNWNGGVDRKSGLSAAELNDAKLNEAIVAEGITEQTALSAFNSVLEYGGASYKRDAVDERIADEVKNGTATFNGSKTGFKGIIDSQEDVGGWPVLNTLPAPEDTDGDGIPDDWEIANGLDPNVPNNNQRNLSTGYDDLEVYINGLVASIIEHQLNE